MYVFILILFLFYFPSQFPCSAIYLHKRVKSVIHCKFLSTLRSVCPVSIEFLKPSFLCNDPRHLDHLFVILRISILSATIVVKSSSLIVYSAHGILSIRLQNHISFVSSLFLTCKEMALQKYEYYIRDQYPFSLLLKEYVLVSSDIANLIQYDFAFSVHC